MIVKKRTLIEMDTKLENIPERWLKIVEPRIKRPANSTCWLWEGACNAEGEPVYNFNNLATGKRNTLLLKRLIADLFWELKRHYEVVHHCGTINCLNPSHFYVTADHWSHEKREEMIAKRRVRLERYGQERMSKILAAKA